MGISRGRLLTVAAPAGTAQPHVAEVDTQPLWNAPPVGEDPAGAHGEGLGTGVVRHHLTVGADGLAQRHDVEPEATQEPPEALLGKDPRGTSRP